MHLNLRNRSEGHQSKGNPLVPRFGVNNRKEYQQPFTLLPKGAPTHNTTSHPYRLTCRVLLPPITHHASRNTRQAKVSRRRSTPAGGAPPHTLSPSITTYGGEETNQHQLRLSGHPHPTLPHARRGMASPCPSHHTTNPIKPLRPLRLCGEPQRISAIFAPIASLRLDHPDRPGITRRKGL
jgi:hypothetical protein